MPARAPSRRRRKGRATPQDEARCRPVSTSHRRGPGPAGHLPTLPRARIRRPRGTAAKRRWLSSSRRP
eukprot:11171531-Lingulodinium_polyedra.AAC.1